MTPGLTDLRRLLASLDPVVRDGEFVYATADPSRGAPWERAEATVAEDEGTTLVLRREVAEAAGFDYDYVAAWITLRVHSSLAAVGLTAAVATALAEAGISCNVLAGAYHDHLLVPAPRCADALASLRALAADARTP